MLNHISPAFQQFFKLKCHPCCLSKSTSKFIYEHTDFTTHCPLVRINIAIICQLSLYIYIQLYIYIYTCACVCIWKYCSISIYPSPSIHLPPSLSLANMSSTGKGQSRVPPGFRFHPTEEELLTYYLRKKVASEKIDLDVIREVDLNKLEPWDIQGELINQSFVSLDS